MILDKQQFGRENLQPQGNHDQRSARDAWPLCACEGEEIANSGVKEHTRQHHKHPHQLHLEYHTAQKR